MTDLSGDKNNQYAGLADYWRRAKEHTYFPVAIVGIIALAVIKMRGQ